MLESETKSSLFDSNIVDNSCAAQQISYAQLVHMILCHRGCRQALHPQSRAATAHSKHGWSVKFEKRTVESIAKDRTENIVSFFLQELTSKSMPYGTGKLKFKHFGSFAAKQGERGSNFFKGGDRCGPSPPRRGTKILL